MRRSLPTTLLFIATLAVGLILLPTFATAHDHLSDGDEQPVVTDSTAESNEDSAAVELEDMLRSDDASSESLESTDDVYAGGDNPTDPATHWLAVLTRSTLAGGITGGLVGVAITLIQADDFDLTTVGQFAGVGALLGLTLGAVEVLFRSNHGSAGGDEPLTEPFERPSSIEWMERQMPDTYDTDLLRIEF